MEKKITIKEEHIEIEGLTFEELNSTLFMALASTAQDFLHHHDEDVQRRFYSDQWERCQTYLQFIDPNPVDPDEVIEQENEEIMERYDRLSEEAKQLGQRQHEELKEYLRERAEASRNSNPTEA